MEIILITILGNLMNVERHLHGGDLVLNLHCVGCHGLQAELCKSADFKPGGTNALIGRNLFGTRKVCERKSPVNSW